MGSFIKKKGVAFVVYGLFTMGTAVIQYLTVLRYCRHIIPTVFTSTSAGRAILPATSAFVGLLCYCMMYEYVKGGCSGWVRGYLASALSITLLTSVTWTLGFITQSIKSSWQPFYTFIFTEITVIVLFCERYFEKYFSCCKKKKDEEDELTSSEEEEEEQLSDVEVDIGKKKGPRKPPKEVDSE